MGVMTAYGGHAARGQPAVRTAVRAAAIDTGAALAAGVVTFSIAFTYGAEAGAGPAFLFQTLPLLFKKMAGGYFIALAFFLLAACAALAAAVALLEAAVAFGAERLGWSRKTAALAAGGVAWAIALPCALSTSLLRGATIGDLTPFELLDRIATSFLVPVAALATSLYCGWVPGPKVARSAPLLWALRIAAPAALLAILVNGL